MTTAASSAEDTEDGARRAAAPASTWALRGLLHEQLAAVAAAWEERCGRKPMTRELLAALSDMSRARWPASPEVHARVDELLAPWLEVVPWVQPGHTPRIRDGDVIRIPYASHGARAIYGHVLFAPTKARPGPGYGVCMVVLDRDVAPGDALADVVRTPWLLRPYHPGTALFKDGLWTIVGNVPLPDPERVLPHFAYRRVHEPPAVRHLRDYFGRDIPDTPENRARVVPPAVGGAGSIVGAVKALRGLGRWRGHHEALLAAGRAAQPVAPHAAARAASHPR